MRTIIATSLVIFAIAIIVGVALMLSPISAIMIIIVFSMVFGFNFINILEYVERTIKNY